jgi:two-component system, chemotaxis family, response regulator Rcp1
VEPTDGPVQILLAEDNLVYADLLQRRLRALPFPYQLSLVTDGEAALAFLHRHAPYTAAPTPDLILLDIHLVKKSGWEVLAEIRATPALATIPVVMLTAHFSPFDEQERERLHPTRCLVKPATGAEYGALLQVVAEVLKQEHARDCRGEPRLP